MSLVISYWGWGRDVEAKLNSRLVGTRSGGDLPKLVYKSKKQWRTAKTNLSLWKE